MLNWSPKYETGIGVIDEQHKKFFATFNRLFEAVIKKESQKELKKVLDELSDYANYHFATEEKYFQDFHYENAAEHIMQHEDFRIKLEKYKENFSKNPDQEKLANEILKNIDEWFSEHLVKMDQKYIQCFRNHGLK